MNLNRSPARPPVLPSDIDRTYDSNHFPLDTARRADTTPYFTTTANLKRLQAKGDLLPDASIPNYQGSPGRPVSILIYIYILYKFKL